MFICLKRIIAFLAREVTYRVIIINLLIFIFSGVILKDHFFAAEFASQEDMPEHKTEDISDKEKAGENLSKKTDEGLSKKAEASEGVPMPKIQYQAEEEGFKDPFRDSSMVKREKKIVQKKTAEPKPLPKLIVQCVIWNSKLPQAIINNKVVKIGDIIDGVKILEIKKDGIKVSFEDAEHFLQPPSIGNLEAVKKRQIGGAN